MIKILLIDDDQNWLDFLSKEISFLGFSSKTINSLAELQSVVESHSDFGMILCDWDLGGQLSGDQIREWLVGRNSGYEEIPFFIVSASGRACSHYAFQVFSKSNPVHSILEVALSAIKSDMKHDFPEPG